VDQDSLFLSYVDSGMSITIIRALMKILKKEIIQKALTLVVFALILSVFVKKIQMNPNLLQEANSLVYSAEVVTRILKRIHI